MKMSFSSLRTDQCDQSIQEAADTIVQERDDGSQMQDDNEKGETWTVGECSLKAESVDWKQGIQEKSNQGWILCFGLEQLRR